MGLEIIRTAGGKRGKRIKKKKKTIKFMGKVSSNDLAYDNE